MIKNLFLTVSALAIGVSLHAQVNVTGGASATYSTVNSAFLAINSGVHTGAITIDITGSTTEPTTPTPLAASGQGLANYTSIILRPTVTATISGNMVTGRGILEFDGADNVSINGDIAGGSVSRDLSIIHTGATTLINTACVRLIGRTTLGLGITSFSLTNCKLWGNSDGANTAAPLTSSFCFYAGTNAANITTTGTGDNYDNLFISNNEFRRSYQAIYAANTAANLGDNALITNNIIGSPTPAEYVHFRGINLSSVVNGTVSGNDISNLRLSSSASNAGIEINGTTSTNMLISTNKIYSIFSTSTNGWGAWGINCTGGTNHTIVNNVIYEIIGSNYVFSTTFNAFGIRLTAGTGYKVYYNSVNLFGDMPTPTANTNAISACFLVTAVGVTGDVRNNVFNNQMTSSAANVTTKRFMAVWMPAAYNFANMTFNNNAYMVSPANTTDYFVGKLGTTSGTFEYQTLAPWQAVSQVGNPTNDINSVPLVNALAPFPSNTNLQFAANAVTPIESGAVIIPSLGLPNKDYNNVNRPAAGINANTNPDMGAYEFDGLAGVSNDVGVIAITAPAVLQCLSATSPVVVTIRNFGINTLAAGVNIPVTAILSGANSQTITSNYVVPGGGFPPSSNVQYTLASTLNMSAFGTYSINATASMTTPLDNNTINNGITVVRTNVAQTAIPIFQGFTGFTGANLNLITPNGWLEAAGASFPSGTTSSWLSQTGLGVAGNITARVNLFGNARREWIVGPKILATASTQVTFDAAITAVAALTSGSNMGSDDQLLVMVSTDCGATYVPIFTVSATNSLSTNFSNFVVPLAAYANQELIVAFLATDGLVDDIESYDIHLDNININNVVASDVGVNAFSTPANSGCYSASNPVTVTFRNFGTAPQSNVNVSVIVSGPVTTTLTTTIAGPVAPASTIAVVVGSVNLTFGGTYTFKGFSSLVGDGNPLNDTTTIVRVINPLVSLPISNPFTGFTGANLPAAQPGWTEAQGVLVPSGTTSSWLSQANLNGVGNITARINLLGTTRNDWIIGPRTLVTPSTQIAFDVALTGPGSILTSNNMGSDDMVRLMVSTDCGLSYTPVFTLSAANTVSTSNTFSNYIVPLGAFAGQEIIVAFLASDGPVDDIESYDFHLDNINLANALATDAGVTAVNAPNPNPLVCYTNAEPVVVTIRNFGTAAISNIPVNVIVGGAVTQTVSGTYAPSIPIGATAVFTVGTLNMTFSGIYTFTATTALPGDANTFNNIALLTATSNPIFNVLGNINVCSGGSTTLTGSNASLTYSWTGGATTQSVVFSPTATSIYTCSGNDGVCTSIRIVTVSLTNPTITGVGATVCSPTAVATLSASAFAPVNWYATPTSTTSLALGNTYTASAPTNTTFFAEAQSTAVGTLTCTMAGGNGSNGNMFDVVAAGNIEVNGFDVHISSVAVTTVEVWFRPGTFVGFETSNVGWTNVLTTTVNGLGSGFLTLVPASFTVPVPAGQTYGFFVTANGGGSFAYTNGTTLGNVHSSNADVAINEGKGGSYFGVTNSPRIFNGNMRYTKTGCTSPRIPVTLTVGVAPTLSVNSSTTAVCSGATVTLTASGAGTYSWSANSATTSAVVVAPTSSSSYTVIGTTAGCTGSAVTSVTVNPNPTILTSPVATLCSSPPSSATLTANGAVSYSWTPGGSNSSSIVVSPSGSTLYSVNGTGANGCVGTGTTGVLVIICTNLADTKNSEAVFNAYPNPNTGVFTIELSQQGSASIQIMDLTGRVVMNDSFSDSKHEINISALSNGIYYARVKNAQGVSTLKIIKE